MMTPRIQEPPLAIAVSPIMEEPNTAIQDAPDAPDALELESIARPSSSNSHGTATEPPSLVATIPESPTPTTTGHTRNSSPFRKAHVRSKSSASSLSAPQMTRAHSSPGSETGERLLASSLMRPSSPFGPSGRHRSPLRRSSDEQQYLSCGEQVDIGETISENSELYLKPRTVANLDGAPYSPSSATHNTFPRVRRRPSSPFHPGTQSISRATGPASFLRTSTSSPSLSAIKFNEPYPLYCSYSTSSVPSTPTSFRSRSPSISSLETIPDSPDAEWEAENIAQLKAAADKENEAEPPDSVRRRGGGEVMGSPEASRDKGKRWSVCGAERRGDLDLETIWED